MDECVVPSLSPTSHVSFGRLLASMSESHLEREFDKPCLGGLVEYVEEMENVLACVISLDSDAWVPHFQVKDFTSLRPDIEREGALPDSPAPSFLELRGQRVEHDSLLSLLFKVRWTPWSTLKLPNLIPDGAWGSSPS